MLRVGIIGLGVGEAHIEGYLSHPGCTIKSLCDFNDKVFDKAKVKYPDYEITKNADDILNDPDIDMVSIASYDNFHFKQIMKGLSNGKHLFIEKPVCLYETEANDILSALKSHPKLKISSNLILRKSERFIRLKNMLDNREFGELSFIKGGYNYGRLNKLTEGWRGEIDFYSVVYGGGLHMIDLMLWLTGERILEVSSFGNNIQTQNTAFKYNDMVATLLKFENGAVGFLSSNFGCVFPHFHQLEIYGTKKTFVNDIEHATIYHSRDKKNNNVVRILNEKEWGTYNNFERIEGTYHTTPKSLHIYNFVESVISNRTPEINNRDIFNAMAVCFAIEKATKNNSIEKVNYFNI